MGVLQLADLIRIHEIHILLDWDGYSNMGTRSTGLFPLRVAPLQMGHQVGVEMGYCVKYSGMYLSVVLGGKPRPIAVLFLSVTLSRQVHILSFSRLPHLPYLCVPSCL